MESGFQTATEGLLSWAERWAPDDAEHWGRWRAALSSEQRGEVLIPLQAALSGLVAFRHLENHPLSVPVSDFRPHLHAVHVALGWAHDLTGRLRPAGTNLTEPEASLVALDRSLTDGVRVTQRLLALPRADAGSFQAGCDLFLRDLSRNTFFRPPEPLEFANVDELVHAQSLSATLEGWKSDAAKMTTAIAFLALVRSHRFLGIADRQIHENDGIYLAHVMVASVRRELRALTRFLLVQGVETLARDLEELRESAEALAKGIHATARTALDVPLPEVDVEGSAVVEGERLRNGIRAVRTAVKEAARELRGMTRPEPTDCKAEPVDENLHRDIWAFRFIVRAFVAKASVAWAGANYWGDFGNVDFVREFVKHYRVFGPRLVRGTDYARRGPLSRAVSHLRTHESISGPSLNLAARECTLFLEHLNTALEEIETAHPTFDKNKAAAELRSYLGAMGRDKLTGQRPVRNHDTAASAFGINLDHAQAS